MTVSATRPMPTRCTRFRTTSASRYLGEEGSVWRLRGTRMSRPASDVSQREELGTRFVLPRGGGAVERDTQEARCVPSLADPDDVSVVGGVEGVLYGGKLP